MRDITVRDDTGMLFSHIVRLIIFNSFFFHNRLNLHYADFCDMISFN